MNLILLQQSDFTDSSRVTLTDARAVHLLQVLRVTPGQTVRVGRIDGPTGSAVVQAAGQGRVTMRCEFEAAPPRPPVDLLLAVPRPKVMRRLWAQLAALGVGQIILTNANRVERDYFATHILTEPTYRPLLLEGLQQARDTRVPRVSIHRQFRVLVEDHLDALFPSGIRLVATPGQTPRSQMRLANTRGVSSWPSARRVDGTNSSCACWASTASRLSGSARALCVSTRRASRFSRTCTPRLLAAHRNDSAWPDQPAGR